MDRKISRNILLVIGFLALVFFLTKVDFNQFMQVIKNINPTYFIWAIMFTFFNVAAKAFRWIFMVQRSTGANIPLSLAMLSIPAGVASGSLFPAKTLDLAKPLIITEYYPQTKLSSMLGVVFVERLADLVILLIALTVLTAFAQSIIPLYILIIAFISIGIAMLYAEKIVDTVRRLLRKRAATTRKPLVAKTCESLSSFLKPLGNWTNPRLSIPLMGYSAAAQAFELIRVYFVLKAVGLRLDFITAGLSFTSSVILGLLSMIPGGIGITENAQSTLLAKLAPDNTLSQIGGGVLLDRMLSYYAIILIGATILFGLKISPERKIDHDRPFRVTGI